MERRDTHTHIISADKSTYPIAPLGDVQSVWSEERPANAERLLQEMDKAGVEKACAVQAATYYGTDNSYVADEIAKTDRLVGVCTVDFLDKKSLDQLRYWFEERNFSGLRLRAANGGATPVLQQIESGDAERIQKAWKYLEENQIPVCIQLHPTDVAEMNRLLLEFPDLIAVFDHSGRPRLDGGPPYVEASEFFRLSEHKNVYLKVTSVSFRFAKEAPGGPSEIAKALVHHFGADHLAWGSNFPATNGSMADIFEDAEKVFSELSEHDREMIFAGTAKKIYPGLA